MKEKEKNTENSAQKTDIMCGIVMPISSMGDLYTKQHWTQVKAIIIEVASDLGYNSRLVSESNISQFIQKDIVQNLYKDDIVICDVSGHNPNVLFELGMRLTFDKPTIIIKDNETDFPFDIQSIRCLEYPIELNYIVIQEFKKRLKDSIEDTLKESVNKGSEYSPFLQHFTIKNISNLSEESTTLDKVVLDEIKALRRDFNLSLKLESQASSLERETKYFNKNNIKQFLDGMDKQELLSKNFKDIFNDFIKYNFSKFSIGSIPVGSDDENILKEEIHRYLFGNEASSA